MAEEKYKNKRYIAKVVEFTNQKDSTTFIKGLVQNPHPETKDGAPNPYHQGILYWYDIATEAYYKIKSFDTFLPTASDAARGTQLVMSLDLENEFQVEKAV